MAIRSESDIRIIYSNDSLHSNIRMIIIYVHTFIELLFPVSSKGSLTPLPSETHCF